MKTFLWHYCVTLHHMTDSLPIGGFSSSLSYGILVMTWGKKNNSFTRLMEGWSGSLVEEGYLYTLVYPCLIMRQEQLEFMTPSTGLPTFQTGPASHREWMVAGIVSPVRVWRILFSISSQKIPYRSDSLMVERGTFVHWAYLRHKSCVKVFCMGNFQNF